MNEVERALYWIIAGTMGGNNRARIIKELLKELGKPLIIKEYLG